VIINNNSDKDNRITKTTVKEPQIKIEGAFSGGIWQKYEIETKAGNNGCIAKQNLLMPSLPDMQHVRPSKAHQHVHKEL